MADMKQAMRDLTSIGARIAIARKAFGLTQAEAARRCEIAKTTFNNYERGINRPDIDNAGAICQIFGITLDWLYTGNTNGLSREALGRLFNKFE